MRARYIKITLWVVALIVGWNLGQSYTVTNSLFLFAAAGVVPGTNIALGPDEVMLTLASVLTLAVLLIFWANIRRGLVRLFRRVSVAEPVDTPAAQPVMAAAVVTPDATAVVAEEAPAKPVKAKRDAPKPVVVIEPPKRPSKVLFLLRVAAGVVAMTVRSWFAKLRSRLQKYSPKVAAFVQRAYLVAAQTVRRGSAIIRREFVGLAIVTGRAAVRTWRWAEPYLRRFDAWLGVQYHRAIAATRRKETYKLVASFGREMRKVFVDTRDQVRSQVRSAWLRVSGPED